MSQHPLARLGWRDELQNHLDDPSLIPARVLAVDRGSVLADAGDGPWRAPLAGRLRRASAMPATGDFVAALPDGPVRAVLPRRGVIARKIEGGRPQVLAANVDLALLATSPNRDLNPRRLARFLAVTARGGVQAVVLLTKADLVGRPGDVRRRASRPGSTARRCVPVSAVDGRGIDAVRDLLEPRRTAVHARDLRGRQVDAAQRPAGRGAAGDERRSARATTAAATRRCGASWCRSRAARCWSTRPGLRLVAPLEDGDEPVPLLDKAQVRRERRAREREFHRSIYRDMRERKRAREARDDRWG